MSNNIPFELVAEITDPENHDSAAARDNLDTRPLPKTLHDLRAGAEHYRPDRKLRIAINTALAVNAPLLLTGEPGTGKTQVAYFLAWYFGTEVFPFQVRSTSTERDLKYDFDAVAYLRYAQHPEEETEPEEEKPRPKTRSDFMEKQALWQAYEHTESTPILLIDEIDKAPRDFPNDLLLELDQHCFKHPFENREIRPLFRPPVVVITSNAERRLPDAFLRRCVLHTIRLDEALVERAIAARVGDFPGLDGATRQEAIARFWDIRRVQGLSKYPSTAELLTWLAVLSAREVKASTLRHATRLAELPGLEVLIKDGDDYQKL